MLSIELFSTAVYLNVFSSWLKYTLVLAVFKYLVYRLDSVFTCPYFNITGVFDLSSGGEAERSGFVRHVSVPGQIKRVDLDQDQLLHLPEPILRGDRVHYLHQRQCQVSCTSVVATVCFIPLRVIIKRHVVVQFMIILSEKPTCPPAHPSPRTLPNPLTD